jgi:hypothetical protein
LHAFDDVANVCVCCYVRQVEGAVEDSFTIFVVGEGTDSICNGSCDKGGVGGLAKVLLASVGEYFIEGLCFDDCSPGGFSDVVGVVQNKDSIEMDMFVPFDPYAKAFENR